MMKPTILLTAALSAALAGAVRAQEAPVQLETKSGTLHGTLLLPKDAAAKVPVALLLSGSGPTDRDGNSPLLPGKNNSLKMVAESLAAHGVASVRYDKRGIGASAGAATSEEQLRFTTYVDDAAAWLEWMRGDSRFSNRVVVGHSEGSLIGIMAAQRVTVDRVISLVGAGRSAGVVLREQLQRTLPPNLFADAQRILGELEAGRTVAEVPQSLMVVFRPSVQPYMISWLPIDPAAEAAKLTVPLLVVQGTTDVQISVSDAERLAKGSPRATLEVVDGMNHVLKEVRETAQQLPSYSNPELPLHPGLVDALVRFVGQR
jgi:alpha-beta hydrolase superfamily lysophospholipase